MKVDGSDGHFYHRRTGEGRREKGWEGKGERRGREGVHNLRKTTPRHQMAGYGPVFRKP